MGRYIAICTVCDEGTNEPYYCDECDKVFCEHCEDLTEQGNGIDDIKSICRDCATEKVGV